MSNPISLPLIIVIIITFLIGMAIGYLTGIIKGMKLGSRHRLGRTPSPLPWKLCFTGSGIALLASAGFAAYSCYFLTSSIQTTGLVVNITEKRNESDGSVEQSLVYSYRDASGKEFTNRSPTTESSALKIGNTVPVRYLEDSPQKSRLDRFSEHWLAPVVMAVFAACMSAMGFWLGWWRNREQQWANHYLTAHQTE